MQNKFGKLSQPTFVVGVVVFVLAVVYGQKLATTAGQVVIIIGLLQGFYKTKNESGGWGNLYIESIGRNDYATFTSKGCVALATVAWLRLSVWMIEQTNINLVVAGVCLATFILLLYLHVSKKVWFGWRVFFGI